MPGYVLSRMFGLSSYKDKTTALVLTAQESIYKVILVLLTFTAILWMSIFLYATFYYTYMPAKSHIRPVHLQFQSCGKEKGLCTFPSAVVTLTQRQQLLMVGQPYKVVVELEMPESVANQQAGMFMICGELRDSGHDVVDKSCRSAILHYKSIFHHIIATFLYAPFLLAGSAEEKQLISLELFSGFQEHPGHPATEAYIEIQSQHVEIYQMYLKIHAHFTGLRYFMFHWPILAAALGISTNFFFLAIIGFLSWYKFYRPKQMIVHVGYDADAARSLEERRRLLAKEQLMKEREELLNKQKIDDNTTKHSISSEDETTKIEKEKRERFIASDEKSKLEEDEDSYIPTIEFQETKKSLEELAKTKTTVTSESTGKDSIPVEERRSSDDFELLSEGNDVLIKDDDSQEENDDESCDEVDKENKSFADESEDTLPSASSDSGVRKRKT